MHRAFATSRIVKRLVRRTHILENEHDGCVVSLLAQEACYGIEEAKPHRFCIGRYGEQHIPEHLAEIRDYLSKIRAPPPYSGTSITTRWPRWGSIWAAAPGLAGVAFGPAKPMARPPRSQSSSTRWK
jgi:hypothetical protein